MVRARAKYVQLDGFRKEALRFDTNLWPGKSLQYEARALRIYYLAPYSIRKG